MQYIVIERFKDVSAIYERLRERGRLMPEGLRYIDSWGNRKFKLRSQHHR